MSIAFFKMIEFALSLKRQKSHLKFLKIILQLFGIKSKIFNN